jgi:hypothetical protein
MTDWEVAQVVRARFGSFHSFGQVYQHLHHSLFFYRDLIKLHTPPGFLETSPCCVRPRDQDGIAWLTAGKQCECLRDFLPDQRLRSYNSH